MVINRCIQLVINRFLFQTLNDTRSIGAIRQLVANGPSTEILAKWYCMVVVEKSIRNLNSPLIELSS